ncbi:hypothetical protein ERJ75_001814000 [Trypanosoma vivax]|nr:hypothetical protein ERJ75_001814000 [Trypanosoma vivax]
MPTDERVRGKCKARDERGDPGEEAFVLCGGGRGAKRSRWRGERGCGLRGGKGGCAGKQRPPKARRQNTGPGAWRESGGLSEGRVELGVATLNEGMFQGRWRPFGCAGTQTGGRRVHGNNGDNTRAVRNQGTKVGGTESTTDSLRDGHERAG